LLVLVASACGQKPGVSEDFSAAGGLPPGATVNEQGQVVDSSGNVIGTTTDTGGLGSLTGSGDLGTGGSTGSNTGSTGDPGSTGSTGSDGSSGDTGSDGSDTGTEPSGGNATGVSDDSFKIGAHAPLTGAAPVPSDSANKGSDVYWKWLASHKQLINGRTGETILKNDNYNPSQAVAVCKEMVEKDQVFLLTGLAGTDQIQACARYAASVGVPYVSAGVTETGLTGLPNYFAITMSYADQGPLLADFLTTDLGAKDEKNGMLRFDTPNFQDAHDAFVQGMESKGSEVVYDRAVSKQADQTAAQTVVQEMKTAGIENVYVLTSPVWFIQVLQAAKTQSYTPQWTGVGITKAIDTVASVGCRNGTLSGAKFFSPYPAWIDINKYDPDFRKAVGEIYPEENGGDDIMLIGWGTMKVIGEMIRATGDDLTRERFVYASERARNLKTNTFPPVSFTPEDHYGSAQVQVNEAQCSGYKAGDNRWHTIQAYVSDF
jgi:ABC-type branched-subunit amino acid transport system substrate-binding protein